LSFFALHGPRINFIERDSAGSDFGLAETERSFDGDQKMLRAVNYSTSIFLGQFR